MYSSISSVDYRSFLSALIREKREIKIIHKYYLFGYASEEYRIDRVNSILFHVCIFFLLLLYAYKFKVHSVCFLYFRVSI